MKKKSTGDFTCTPVAEDVYQIQLTHFSYRLVNAYLLAGTRPTLIDTGHLESRAFVNLEKALATIGYCVEDIESIIYTHPHIDHLGGGVLINGRNPSVHNIGFIGAVEAFRNQKDYNVALTRNAHHFFDTRGSKAPPKHLDGVKQFFTDYLICDDQTGVTLSTGVEDGMVVQAGRFNLQVLHTPAHTPWDISLYEPRNGLLITGDFLLEKVASLYSTVIASDVDAFRSSLRKVEVLSPTVLLPGHGRLIDQPHAIIENWKQLIARRAAKITGLLKQGAGDVYDLASAILADEGEPGDTWYRLLGFVDTYLLKLAREGQVKQEWENDRVYYVWRK
jgi:glyoxylase-like metal-dependent hydrolase (beta-lactamase superfamily II)